LVSFAQFIEQKIT